MLEITFEAFPEIITARLLLRQLRPTDAEAFFFQRSDPQMMQYIDRPLMKSAEEAEALIENILESYKKNEGILWGISLIDDPKMIGTITFWKLDKENHRAEIGYMLRPDQQGKGLMQEAITAILQYGFETMRLHSVEANVNPENVASIKLLERNGFVREGYFRENYHFDGRFLDSAIYSLITPIK